MWDENFFTSFTNQSTKQENERKRFQKKIGVISWICRAGARQNKRITTTTTPGIFSTSTNEFLVISASFIQTYFFFLLVFGCLSWQELKSTSEDSLQPIKSHFDFCGLTDETVVEFNTVPRTEFSILNEGDGEGKFFNVVVCGNSIDYVSKTINSYWGDNKKKSSNAFFSTNRYGKFLLDEAYQFETGNVQISTVYDPDKVDTDEANPKKRKIDK